MTDVDAASIKRKLIELVPGSDADSLTEYVELFSSQAKSRHEWVDEMREFLHDKTEIFVDWLLNIETRPDPPRAASREGGYVPAARKDMPPSNLFNRAAAEAVASSAGPIGSGATVRRKRDHPDSSSSMQPIYDVRPPPRYPGTAPRPPGGMPRMNAPQQIWLRPRYTPPTMGPRGGPQPYEGGPAFVPYPRAPRQPRPYPSAQMHFGGMDDVADQPVIKKARYDGDDESSNSVPTSAPYYQPQAPPRPRAPRAPPALQAAFPGKVLKRCRNWPRCESLECYYVHPSSMCQKWPNCSFGQECLFIHPEAPCRHGIHCKNARCNYTHPVGWQPPPVEQTWKGGREPYRNLTLSNEESDGLVIGVGQEDSEEVEQQESDINASTSNGEGSVKAPEDEIKSAQLKASAPAGRMGGKLSREENLRLYGFEPDGDTPPLTRMIHEV